MEKSIVRKSPHRYLRIQYIWIAYNVFGFMLISLGTVLISVVGIIAIYSDSASAEKDQLPMWGILLVLGLLTTPIFAFIAFVTYQKRWRSIPDKKVSSQTSKFTVSSKSIDIPGLPRALYYLYVLWGNSDRFRNYYLYDGENERYLVDRDMFEAVNINDTVEMKFYNVPDHFVSEVHLVEKSTSPGDYNYHKNLQQARRRSLLNGIVVDFMLAVILASFFCGGCWVFALFIELIGTM